MARRPALVLDGNGIIVELDESILWQLSRGCNTSVSVNPDASYLAQSHAYSKAERLSAPDLFCRINYVYSSVNAEKASATHMESLQGADKKLASNKIRVLDIPQSVRLQSGHWETYFITAVYTKSCVAFVSLRGRVLLVRRDQIFWNQNIQAHSH